MPDFSADLSARVADLARRARSSSPSRQVVLIDGRSGSGKTTLGRALTPLLDAQLVELDDVYPGWQGLASASATVAESILRPARPGYRRWDWDRAAPADWRSLDASRPLVVEGAGALTPSTAALATLCVWVELDEITRRARVALRPDAQAYAPWWDMWAAQEARHLAVDNPRALADVVIEA